MGVELKKDQVSSLFEKGVEHLTDQLNKIIKKKFIDQLVPKVTNDNSHKVKKEVSSVPLGDCIKIEYSDEGEMIGFLLRPKLANLVFLKEKTDIHVLSQMLKIVIYLNRLMYKGSTLIQKSVSQKKQRRGAIVAVHKKDAEVLKQEVLAKIPDEMIEGIDLLKDDEPTNSIGIQVNREGPQQFLSILKAKMIELYRRCNRLANVSFVENAIDV